MVIMALDEKLLEQMHRLELEEEASARKEAWDKEALTGVLTGSLLVDGTRLEFHRESLLEDKVSIMIPNTFAEMAPELAALKYPSDHRPNPIFSNDAGSITLGFNHTWSRVEAEEIGTFKDILLQNLHRMQSSITVLEDGVKNVNGQSIGYFEFISPALDSDLYNLMFFLELDGRALLCAVNCLESDLEQWQPIAKGIMESIRIESEAGKSNIN
jgi:hypothetical protein